MYISPISINNFKSLNCNCPRKPQTNVFLQNNAFDSVSFKGNNKNKDIVSVKTQLKCDKTSEKFDIANAKLVRGESYDNYGNNPLEIFQKFDKKTNAYINQINKAMPKIAKTEAENKNMRECLNSDKISMYRTSEICRSEYTDVVYKPEKQEDGTYLQKYSSYINGRLNDVSYVNYSDKLCSDVINKERYTFGKTSEGHSIYSYETSEGNKNGEKRRISISGNGTVYVLEGNQLHETSKVTIKYNNDGKIKTVRQEAPGSNMVKEVGKKFIVLKDIYHENFPLMFGFINKSKEREAMVLKAPIL